MLADRLMCAWTKSWESMKMSARAAVELARQCARETLLTSLFINGTSMHTDRVSSFATADDRESRTRLVRSRIKDSSYPRRSAP